MLLRENDHKSRHGEKCESILMRAFELCRVRLRLGGKGMPFDLSVIFFHRDAADWHELESAPEISMQAGDVVAHINSSVFSIGGE